MCQTKCRLLDIVLIDFSRVTTLHYFLSLSLFLGQPGEKEIEKETRWAPSRSIREKEKRRERPWHLSFSSWLRRCYYSKVVLVVGDAPPSTLLLSYPIDFSVHHLQESVQPARETVALFLFWYFLLPSPSNLFHNPTLLLFLSLLLLYYSNTLSMSSHRAISVSTEKKMRSWL